MTRHLRTIMGYNGEIRRQMWRSCGDQACQVWNSCFSNKICYGQTHRPYVRLLSPKIISFPQLSLGVGILKHNNYGEFPIFHPNNTKLYIYKSHKTVIWALFMHNKKHSCLSMVLQTTNTYVKCAE